MRKVCFRLTVRTKTNSKLLDFNRGKKIDISNFLYHYGRELPNGNMLVFGSVSVLKTPKWNSVISTPKEQRIYTRRIFCLLSSSSRLERVNIFSPKPLCTSTITNRPRVIFMTNIVLIFNRRMLPMYYYIR